VAVGTIELVLRFFIAALQLGMGGSLLTSYVTSDYDARKPYLRQMFLAFSGVGWVTGIYLIVATVLLL